MPLVGEINIFIHLEGEWFVAREAVGRSERTAIEQSVLSLIAG